MNSPFTIGVAGHVDHGKTTLVRHLTGIDTDRRKEERDRGLSIDSGVAALTLPSGRQVALIDVPGHTDFLKNTIRGLNGVDLAVMVVAVDDGVMPQTREHLDILNFFKVSAGFSVLNKIDLADDETIELAELELSDLLTDTFLDNCPIFKFTHQKPDRCDSILQAIDNSLADLPTKQSRLPFRMWIDQIKSFKGRGTVVSGTVASGMIRCDDVVDLMPNGIKTRIRSLESHNRSVPHAVAGQRVGINLHRIPVKDVRRGMVLTAPGFVEPVYMLNADIRVLLTAKTGIKNRQRVKMYLGTSINNALVVLMKGECLEPGETGLVQFRLMKPVSALPQDTVVVTPLNRNTVIAGGQIIETTHEKYRFAKAESVFPLLSALQNKDVHAYVDGVFEQAQGCLITASELSQKTGLPYRGFEGLINSKVQKGELVYVKGHGAIKHRHMIDFKERVKAVIEALFGKNPLKRNVGLNEISKEIGHAVDDFFLKHVADILRKEGVIERHSGGYILSNSEDALDKHWDELVRHLLNYAQSSGLTPFSADTFWKCHRPKYEKAEISQILNYLFSRKRIIRLKDSRFLSLQALADIKERVKQAIEIKGFITITDCKDLLGYGRWGGTHVLDYLNQINFTVRRDNKHYLIENSH